MIFFNKRKYTREIFKAKLKEVKEFDEITEKDITNSVGLLKYKQKKAYWIYTLYITKLKYG